MINEICLEICAGCRYGTLMEDQAGEFIVCGLKRSPYQCEMEGVPAKE